MEDKIDKINSRTEEVQHIIDRMPTKFGFWVSAIIVLLFLFVVIFGWAIRYPDIVQGQVIVNTQSAPLKLVANTSGKIKLCNVKSMDFVKSGQLIAYIESPTNLVNVFFIDSLLHLYNPATVELLQIREKLPKHFSMGELNSKYYAFDNSLQDYINFKQDKQLDNQRKSLVSLLNEQQYGISSDEVRVEMAKKTAFYEHKAYGRDSILFVNRVISESEFDKSQMNYLAAKDALQNTISNLNNAQQAEQQTRGKIQDLDIKMPENEKQLKIALTSAYNDLLDNIKSWKERYVFLAPFSGKAQFMKFYTENQFVQTGEEVFTIVPKEENAFGQVILPAQGSGKIRKGQEVIVKLDNYPYMEYGSINGRVKSISLTTNTTKSGNNEVETYMALIDFPDQLKTNYKVKLDFKAEAKGTAEIITSDRRLIQRLFDNLKYILKK